MKEQDLGASAGRPGSREPSPTVSAASGFDPSRKIKGLTESQSLALLWCAPYWRRVRGEFNNKIFRGRGLRRYVEWVWNESHGRFKVRLTEDGAALLASIGVTNPPYFDTEFQPRPQTPRDSDGSGEAGETRSGSTEGDSAGRQASPNP